MCHLFVLFVHVEEDKFFSTPMLILVAPGCARVLDLSVSRFFFLLRTKLARVMSTRADVKTLMRAVIEKSNIQDKHIYIYMRKYTIF